ncbi:MAG TPA: cupin domain-containing protein [Bacteroidetes bacterium]|nr:cupin domain-containing protein [Bacteroidota bacterium]
MKTASLFENLEFQDQKPAIKVLFDTAFTKEIRIALKAEQVMKKHQTPFPIVVELVDGELDFGVNGEVLHLKKGDLIALDGGVPHDLKAITNSVVRLTLTKSDEANRVKNVINK